MDFISIKATLTLIFLALIYTTPWDSYLIRQGIWSYPPDSVWDTVWGIPLEEYFFFCIQTLIGCLITFHLLKMGWGQVFPLEESRKAPPKGKFPISMEAFQKILFMVIALLILSSFLWAWGFVSSPNPHRYLSLILVWALPILFVQWCVGFNVLMNYWKVYLTAWWGLTAYFSMADWVAVKQGLWFFDSGQISHIFLFAHLPLEEFLFFFFTNAMVVQGFILFYQLYFSGKKKRT